MNCGGKSRRFVCAIVATMLWGLFCTIPVTAAITATGDIDPAYDNSDPWILVQDLILGASADASLVIADGAHVTAYDTYLSPGEGDTASLTVTGVGSLFDNQNDLYIGKHGVASLQIADGGRMVTGPHAYIAYDQMGDVSITGAGSSWDSQGSLSIGSGGQGSLTVSAGGLVTSDEVSIGFWGTGAVTVTDPNSRLEYSWLGVGVVAQGTLTIANGGRAVGTTCSIAELNTPTGTVVVTGAGSMLENSGDLSVGVSGKGTLLVSEGGRVENGGDAAIAGPIDLILPLGIAAMASAEIIIVEPNLVSGPSAVTVTGEGSAWINAGNLYVGGGSDAEHGLGRLRIFDGGLVEANDVHLWNTSILLGDGTLHAGNVLVQGAIRPGSSIGALTIEGDVTFDPCSVLEVEIANADADKLTVTGDVDIVGGTVRLIATETITGSHQYEIVDANNVSGEFDALDAALLDSFVLLEIVGLGYDSDSVLLTITPVSFDDPNFVRTDNHYALGSALQEIAEDGGNGITTALQQLQTDGEVLAAYDQLSGQTTPSLAPVTVAGATRHVGMISGRLRSPAGSFADASGLGQSWVAGLPSSDLLGIDTSPYLFAVGGDTPVLGEKPWGIWGKGYGLFGDRDSESGVPGYDYTVYGTAFGLDYRFTDSLLLGVTAGYSDGDVDYSDSRDNSEVSAIHGGLYGSYETSRWYLDSIVTYADLDYETRRYVDLVDERLDGDSSGDLFTGYVEVGLNRWLSGRTLLQPLAALQFSTLHIDGFTESGGDSALTFDDQRYDSCKGSLGAKLTRRLWERADGRRGALELRGRWVHEFGDTKATLDAGFASDPAATFRVSDESMSRDSAVLGTGIDAWFTRQTRLFLDYGTELNADHTAHLISAGLEHRW